MSEKKYFRVSAAWMKTHGFDDSGEARVFEVLREKARSTPAGNEPIILVLKSEHHANGEWMVFITRGHFVAPYTIVLIDGLFSPAPADVQVVGVDVKTCSQFDTFQDAQAKALKLNNAIREAYTARIPKAPAYTIKWGTFVRKLDSEGFPRAKTYRMEGYDEDRGRWRIVDPLDSGKIVFVNADTLLALDE